MPNRCVVPNCRGNYRLGPKVSSFSFPKANELLSIWIRAIKRENFVPTKHSKVCELHFRPEDIKRESSAFDVKTGKTITVKLVKKCLRDGAVPSIIPPPPSPSSIKQKTKKIKSKNSTLENASPSILTNSSSSSSTKQKTPNSKKNSDFGNAFPRIRLRSPSSLSSTTRKTRVSEKIKLKNTARKSTFPRILQNVTSSSYSKKRKTKKSKKIKLDDSDLESTSNQSIDDDDDFEHYEPNVFRSIDHLEAKLDFHDKNYWSVVRQRDALIICHIVKSPSPQISLSLVIEKDFAVHVFCSGVEINSIGEYTIPTRVTNVNTLEVLLENMKELDPEEAQAKPQNMISVLKLISSFLLLVQNESLKYFNAIKFIYEQVNLMTQNKLNYSTEMIMFSSLLYSCSPQGYRLLKETKKLILPNFSTIRRLSLPTYVNPLVAQRDNYFLMYIKNKFKSLLEEDISVSLLVDEIRIKPYVDCTGSSAVDGNEAATSVFVFMLRSVSSEYKDVVHVMPAKCLKAENLFDIVKRLIVGLEEIGFKVLAVVTDNDTRNKKAMSLFCNPEQLSIVYPHPVVHSRPLFFLFDSLDVLKCIRNNWLAQKDKNKCMMFPKFCHDGNHELGNIQSAPFSTLQKLHNLQSQSLLKHGHKLTSEAISPAALKRQNVSSVLQIFNEYTVKKLQMLGKQKCLPNFAEVSGYIDIFYIWWTILNVKTLGNPYCRLRNKYCDPLRFKNENFKFLSIFCNWLESWDRIAGNNGKLTDETFTAIHHTTYAIMELTKYCKNELKMRYVLPGKFQMDHLEEILGQCWQLSEDQYIVSIDEVLECEKKLSGLKLCLLLNNQSIDLTDLQETNWDGIKDKEEEEKHFDVYKLNVDVTDNDVDECKAVFPVLTYLAGYCCYEVFKMVKCNSCKTLISGSDDAQPETNTFFRGVDNGSLLYPNEMSRNIVLYNYVVVNKLVRNSSLLRCPNHKKLMMHATLNILENAELLFNFDVCDEGHSVEEIEKMLVWCSLNALLNNFSNKSNGDITSDTLNKKKGLETND